MRIVCQLAVWTLLLCTTVEAGPPVTLTLLDGASRTGDLEKLSPDSLTLVVEGVEQSVPLDQVMELDFGHAEKPLDGITTGLVDLSQIQSTEFQTDGTTVTLSAPGLGELSLPLRQLTDVRLKPLDDKIAASWKELRARNTRDDLLVFQKGDVLDYAAGSIARVTAENVVLLARGRELSAPRERVFGVVFASRGAPAATGKVQLHTVQKSVLAITTASLSGNDLSVQSTLGELKIPLDEVKSIDYGGGRIKFLADLPFDSTESKAPGADQSVVWFVARNSPAGSGGRLPLLIGKQEYRRGLWLHSGAVLRFRLNREFTRLKCQAGFERTHVVQMPRFEPRVRLVLQGDGKELWSKEFLWSDSPVPLDVDLTNVRELLIRVESLGPHEGVLEHFALGDAQVIQ
ncbi:NPCBM/NEW2 domain-containing protein [Planctomicrobium sp. SH664]|uniref:NPCBM/NEW2 domain-containing protein n=1 Tax=Planctomicrobium sp. SH664 TaxID=3448125 RepID=UPI003F5C17A5